MTSSASRRSQRLRQLCVASFLGSLTLLSPLARSQDATASRIFEGSSLPLRSVNIPMFVERENGDLTPFGLVPSLQPGDKLVIKRPSDLAVDLSVAAVAWSADSKYEPKGKFWAANRVPKKPDDCILLIPSKPSVVIVTYCVHGNSGTVKQMQRTIELQGEKFVQNAAEFTYRTDQRARWNVFFDALQAAPDGDDATSLKEYATRLSKDLGISFPSQVDVGSSKSVRESVAQTAAILEQLRQSSPEELQKTVAGMAAPLIPGTYRDYIGIVLSLYKLAFRPPSEQKLVFVPAVTTFSGLNGFNTQVIAAKAFPRTGAERTVGFLNIPVGKRNANRSFRVSTARKLIDSPQVVVPIEEFAGNAKASAVLLGSSYLWDWKLNVAGKQLPATFEPGLGVIATMPDQDWSEFQAGDVRVSVKYGSDLLQTPNTMRVVKSRPSSWKMSPEEKSKIVSGSTIWLTAETQPSELVQPGDIELVTFVSASGERLAAKQVVYDPGTGKLRVLLPLSESAAGPGQLVIKLLDRPQPDRIEDLWCFAAMPGLSVVAPRAGDSTLVIEKDSNNRVVAVVRENGDEEKASRRLSDGRTAFTLSRPVSANESRLLAKLQDGRLVELPLFVKGALPQFSVEPTYATGLFPVGEKCSLQLPAGFLVPDLPVRFTLVGSGSYALKPKTQVQVGFKSRASAVDKISQFVTIPAGQVWLDEGEAATRIQITTQLSTLLNQDLPNNQMQIFIRIAEPNDDFSAWQPVLTPETAVPLTILRTPTIRGFVREGTSATITFVGSAMVLGACSTETGQLIPTVSDGQGNVRVTIPDATDAIYVQVASISGRLLIKLPPQG